MKLTDIIILLFFVSHSCYGQIGEDQTGMFALSWSHALYTSSNDFDNNLFSSDSLNIESIDSIGGLDWGFEAMFASPRVMFLVGAQPVSTWIGDQSFRLKYTFIDENNLVTTSDSTKGHFRHASFFIGLGYRFGKTNQHFDAAVIPYFEKQTGRFIIHDDVYDLYLYQQELSTEERNKLPDEDRINLNDLTQERTRIFAFGLRLNLSYGITLDNAAGLIFSIAPRAQYSYLIVEEELYTRKSSRISGNWSFGGLFSIGMLIAAKYKKKG